MKIGIIGAGPCGIMAAITYKKNHMNDEVLLFDKNKNIGQRIKVSGNGRCNFMNLNFSPEKYNHPEFIKGYEHEFKLFKSYLDDTGFYYFADEEGRCYPNSETSSSFLYILNKLLKKYKVNTILETTIYEILKNNNKYVLKSDNKEYIVDKVVVTIGGVSLNNDRSLYNKVLNSISCEITQLDSSLTPISTTQFSPKMEGKRCKTNVKLMKGNDVLKEERGEVLFKKNGVSGIVIFNMSSYLSRLHLSNFDDYSLNLDLLPNMPENVLKTYKNIDSSLHNILQEDIADEVVKNRINPKEFKLGIKALYDLKNSQVTSGGVSLKTMNTNLSLKKDNNIFVGGETIDIDGECGGYNIEFALLSGIRIGENL